MPAIKNKEALVANGRSEKTREARLMALNGLEQAVKLADPKAFLSRHVTKLEDCLRVDGLELRLGRFERLFVVGAGKAAGAMAEFIESILGDRITDGWVNVLKGTGKNCRLRRIHLHEASHPIPDESSVLGASRILEIVKEAGAGDLVICLLSGGGSALMSLPRDGLSLRDKQRIVKDLMLAGANINELNCVRKHLSAVKGGWLAKEAYPATVVSLILSDVVGDDLSTIASGPTVPDGSTFKDAAKILKRYGLWKGCPPSVRRILADGEKGFLKETPKEGEECFNKVRNFIVGSNREVCLELSKFYRSLGLNSIFLTSQLEGEAREAGIFFASLLKEARSSGNPVPIPCAIILGGETTVTVKGEGLGGRNQESMASACVKMDGMDGACMASMGTDGIDGPTDAAGALVDGYTLRRAGELGLSPKEALQNNDSYTFFKKLGDLIFTGPTGTNVNDIAVLISLNGDPHV